MTVVFVPKESRVSGYYAPSACARSTSIATTLLTAAFSPSTPLITMLLSKRLPSTVSVIRYRAYVRDNPCLYPRNNICSGPSTSSVCHSVSYVTSHYGATSRRDSSAIHAANSFIHHAYGMQVVRISQGAVIQHLTLPL